MQTQMVYGYFSFNKGCGYYTVAYCGVGVMGTFDHLLMGSRR